MESGSAALVPAPVWEPPSAVPYQFIAEEGPAWKTLPSDQAKSQPWLSARKIPCASAVSIGATGQPGRSVQVLSAVL